jgi:hypothetical protein
MATITVIFRPTAVQKKALSLLKSERGRCSRTSIIPGWIGLCVTLRNLKITYRNM